MTNARAAWLARHVLPHEPALRGWLMRRRVPGLEVDDVLQDTYARLIMRDDLEGVRDPRAYAYQTAWSVVMTHVRRSKVVSIQTMAHIDQLGLPADEISPETQVADREELQRLAMAIAALPGKIQDVFRLRRVEGLPQKDVAARLGLAESTVEKHMRRGLLLLLERFSRGGITTPGASRTTTEETGPRHAQGDG